MLRRKSSLPEDQSVGDVIPLKGPSGGGPARARGSLWSIPVLSIPPMRSGKREEAMERHRHSSSASAIVPWQFGSGRPSLAPRIGSPATASDSSGSTEGRQRMPVSRESSSSRVQSRAKRKTVAPSQARALTARGTSVAPVVPKKPSASKSDRRRDRMLEKLQSIPLENPFEQPPVVAAHEIEARAKQEPPSHVRSLLSQHRKTPLRKRGRRDSPLPGEDSNGHVPSRNIPNRTYYGGVYFVPRMPNTLDRKLTTMFPELRLNDHHARSIPAGVLNPAVRRILEEEDDSEWW